MNTHENRNKLDQPLMTFAKMKKQMKFLRLFLPLLIFGDSLNRRRLRD